MRNALGHIGMGLLLMAPFCIAGHPWLGWACQSFYWLGRERRDHEVAHGGVCAHGLAALKCWNFIRWSRDGVKDLLAPVVANAGVAWAVSYA